MSAHHEHVTLDPKSVELPKTHLIAKLPVLGLVMAVAGFGLGYTLGGENHHHAFAYASHTAITWALSLGLGCLFFVIAQFATKAGWSVVVRRLAENAAGTLPVVAIVALVLIMLNSHTLFHHWMEPEDGDKFLEAKSAWLNLGAFKVRMIIYPVIWALLAWFFLSKSTRQDQTGDHEITRKLQNFSYPAIALFALSLTFASFDWIKSLDPHWYSTVFGVYFFAGSFVAAYALLIVLVTMLRNVSGYSKLVTTEHMHDLGKMMFGINCFWAYIAFCQFFLIWCANIPEETVFYKHRFDHGWMTWTLLLAIGHFVLPFVFLLSRHVKRHPVGLFLGAIWMLLMHYVDVYWLVAPNGGEPHFGLVEISTAIGALGLFLAVFGFNAQKRALVPVKDPRLDESIHFENL